MFKCGKINEKKNYSEERLKELHSSLNVYKNREMSEKFHRRTIDYEVIKVQLFPMKKMSDFRINLWINFIAFYINDEEQN